MNSPIPDIHVVDYSERWRDDFARLNLEWLERWFTVEPIDREVLGDPGTHILAGGGHVLFAVNGEGRAHAVHAHLILPKATSALFAPALGRFPRAGEDLLNGGLSCYSLYGTADGRHLAVGALEFKFWKAACEVFERPDWVERHWQRGLALGSADSAALRAEVAARVATHTLAYWTERIDPVDACVTPVLTLEEARSHPLFSSQPRAGPWDAVHSSRMP